ncbi:MAG: DUF1697 domain-containing protein [Deltaproteobacteria bacterium]|nr:DUF1697 domain-containing protein [Deltaproteobacteria bacterium]
MSRYVALLRGINVGGKNVIQMGALAECFRGAGMTAVVTYIQSGNVVFESGEAAAAVVERLETAIERRFVVRVPVMLRTAGQLRSVVGRAPARFGAEPESYRYDVLFLAPKVSSAAVLEVVPRAPGVDEVHAGTGVLYFRRLILEAAKSKLSRLVAMPVYKTMTIRNWATTTALARLAGGADP